MAVPADKFIRSLLGEAKIAFIIAGDQKVSLDWAAPPRTLPFHLLYFVTEHGFAGQVRGRPIRVDAGTMLWVMPNVPHAFWIEPGQPAFSVRYFRVAIDRHHQPLRIDDDFIVVEDAWEAGQVMQQIVDELPSNLPLGAERLRSLLILLFTSALRLRDRRREGGHSLSRSQRVTLTRLAREHAADRLTPADLAAALDLSPDYFARLFRKSFDLSPRAWLVDQRIRHAAAAMVNSTRSASQIALDFGYDDVFLFSRQFKQVLGMGPLRYRRAHGSA